MAQDKITPSKDLSPLHNFIETSMHGWNAAAQAFGPAPRVVALWQIEMMGLTSRNMRASAKFFKQVKKCRTAKDFSEQQMAFAIRAAEDVAKTTERLLQSWSKTVAVKQSKVGKTKCAVKQTKHALERDYLPVEPVLQTRKNGNSAPKCEKKPPVSVKLAHIDSEKPPVHYFGILLPETT